MELSRWLFHQITIKEYVYTPESGLRGVARDEESDERWLGRMQGQLSFAGKTVLDVGCGGGTLAIRAASAGAAHVTGVDLEIERPEALLREEHPDLADRVDFVATTGDLGELGDRQFDLVTSKDSMEHFPDPESFIDLMTPRVRPGGELALGFSPLWKSPKGGHMGYMTKVPWAHLMFPEKTIMAERRRFRPDEDADRFEDIRGGLNKMTLGRFQRIMAATGFEPVYVAANPGDRPVLKAMRAVAAVPGLREYLTVGVYSIWRKPEGKVKHPRDFFKPQAIGAPQPLTEIPVTPSRMIHFLDFSNPKMVAKASDIAKQTDILLGNLEDAVPVDRKEPARAGLIQAAKESDFGTTSLWTRVNSLESPWILDDLEQLVGEIGDRLDVIMVPKVEGDWDIHYVDRLLAQLEAKAGIERPILIHALLETPQGVVNVEEIANASPRMQGMSFGPADLAAARRMKTTRVGGGHPGYRVMEDPTDPDNPEENRVSAQQDLWHYSIARMVDACAAAGILPFYGPFGDIKDVAGCETQFRAAFLMGCVGAWSLHPVQIGIAKKVFSPPPEEVKFAKKVLEAIPDGAGVHMIDGKMQDDATWKQCKVMVELAEMLAAKDPELKEAYEL